MDDFEPRNLPILSPEAESFVSRRHLIAFRLELQQRPPNFLAVPLFGQILAQQKARPRHLNLECESTTRAGRAADRSRLGWFSSQQGRLGGAEARTSVRVGKIPRVHLGGEVTGDRGPCAGVGIRGTTASQELVLHRGRRQRWQRLPYPQRPPPIRLLGWPVRSVSR